MNKRTIIIAVVAILALVGLYFVMGTNNKAVAPSPEDTIGMKDAPKSMFSKGETSFKSLMTSSVPQKCTFNGMEGTKSTGSIYVSGGNMRIDTEMTGATPTETRVMHMLSLDGTMYAWGDKENVGMKMKIDKEQLEAQQPMSATATAKVQATNDDLEKRANVDCSAWSPDATAFTVPAGVKFQDMDAMMKNMLTPQMQKSMQTGAGAGATVGAGASAAQAAQIKAMQCGACDQVSGSDREQCRAALSC